ncbi:DUF3788 family protein [Chryseobacterium daecheongense]|uniref:DUF3788 domain-containing protein n=1 Tax=Chryseobacterium daecheongense TaxID=192389 RepID=A0A3N0W609_9FLAO|nr:DUF3788 family protein [Chryseobacterium daecheongense]ROI00453.1 DUF3788 domain-containing protein [Chryseobacterium daecheongense]TDX94576.1 uncharacterized protein DUF3788 [Chryseobacterium daecheongense]
MTSIFTDKTAKPSEDDLKIALGEKYKFWNELFSFTLEKFPEASFDWHFSGQKFGWGFRISDKKRVLVYLLPRDQFFKVGLVFGEKAFEEVCNSSISETLITELKNTKKYAEGRGIRIDIRNDSFISDLKKLIEIKIKH